jgi:hypothetical protein
MNIEFNHLPASSRVWVYAASRPLTETEQELVKSQALAFTDGWTAHQVPLKASFMIVKDVFLVFGVDIAHHDISGCGIDKSVHLVQKWEQELGVSFFDRMQLEYEQNGELRLSNKSGMQQALEQGVVNEHTPFYNKTVNTVGELNSIFIVPFKQSWVYSHLVKQAG